jgi:hypothetical protein
MHPVAHPATDPVNDPAEAPADRLVHRLRRRSRRIIDAELRRLARRAPLTERELAVVDTELERLAARLLFDAVRAAGADRVALLDVLFAPPDRRLRLVPPVPSAAHTSPAPGADR